MKDMRFTQLIMECCNEIEIRNIINTLEEGLKLAYGKTETKKQDKKECKTCKDLKTSLLHHPCDVCKPIILSHYTHKNGSKDE